MEREKMQESEIKDWQFGQLNYEDGWGWCAKNVEWLSNITTDLCIQAELTENNSISEQTREIFNNLREREKEFKLFAANELLDSFNENMSNADEEFEILDTESFLNLLSLYWVFIDENGECELQYLTGLPLVRIIISQDLNFKEAFFDGYYQ